MSLVDASPTWQWSSLYTYWESPNRSNEIGFVPWVFLAMLGVVICLIYESWVNPR
jgi:hypothetical protein